VALVADDQFVDVSPASLSGVFKAAQYESRFCAELFNSILTFLAESFINKKC